MLIALSLILLLGGPVVLSSLHNFFTAKEIINLSDWRLKKGKERKGDVVNSPAQKSSLWKEEGRVGRRLSGGEDVGHYISSSFTVILQ